MKLDFEVEIYTYYIWDKHVLWVLYAEANFSAFRRDTSDETNHNRSNERNLRLQGLFHTVDKCYRNRSLSAIEDMIGLHTEIRDKFSNFNK